MGANLALSLRNRTSTPGRVAEQELPQKPKTLIYKGFRALSIGRESSDLT